MARFTAYLVSYFDFNLYLIFCLTRFYFDFVCQYCADKGCKSKFPLRARQLAGDARVVPARAVHRARERLEQRLDDVMRLVAVKQFEVQIAARLVRKALKKFARESEPERARHVLIFFRPGNFLLRKFVQPAPDKMRSSAKIHDAARETFIHRHIRFAGERIFRMKSKTITTNPFFVAER